MNRSKTIQSNLRAADPHGPTPARREEDPNLAEELLDLVQDAVLVRGYADGRIAHLNHGAEALYGWAKDEARGQVLHALLHTIFPRPLAEIENELLRAGHWTGELAHTRRDGTRAVVSSRWTLRLDAGGQPAAVVEVHTDLTARRSAEAYFRSLLESAPDPILAVDARGRIALVNSQTERLFGYARAELLGQPLELLVPERMRERHQAHRSRYEGHPSVRPMGRGLELRARRKDGSEFPAEISLSPVETDGGVQVISVIRDITERKLAEQQRLDLAHARVGRAEAEAALRVRSDVLASVSHDLKNPLTAIRGRAELLQRRVARSGVAPDDPLVQGLAQMAASATRAMDQLEELVDASHLEIGHVLELSRAPTDLVALAREALGVHRATTERHRMILQAHDDEVLGLWDARRLARVVDNLLSNAVKYSPAGGDVIVAVGSETDGTHEMAVLAVSDQGIGIPATDLPRLFERFHRGSNVTDTIVGTGLGLAGAKRIVEQHGGTIDVESVEGQGSTFTVRLPLVRGELG